MKKSLRVLVSAFGCAPGRGSEPGMGWEWVRQVARLHEVWVITWSDTQSLVERACAEKPLTNVHWQFYEPSNLKWVNRLGPAGESLYYYLWQIGTYGIAKRLHAEIEFDLVHHVTLGKYWAPSFLCLLGVPFIWGPVGGGDSGPASLRSTLSFRGRLYETARTCAQAIEEADPFVRLTARRATLGLAKTEETGRRLRALGCRNVRILPELSLAVEELRGLGAISRRDEAPFRLLSIGRLLHWKGFHLGLMAFARLQQEFPSSEYMVVGDGPERQALEALAHKLGIQNKVRFCGSLPQADAHAMLAECDVLVHPSLHDSGGWVCTEAMAARRPVICLDWGGPALRVTEDTGFKVTPGRPEMTIDELARAMASLAGNAELRRRMGDAAQRRVTEQFLSEAGTEALGSLYDGVLDSLTPRDPLRARQMSSGGI